MFHLFVLLNSKLICIYGTVLGEHPRIGAMDVCPFIPVRGVTMDDCVECAREFAERLATELSVPGKPQKW